MNEVYNNIVTRRSVRAFTNQPISKENLYTIAKAGVHAPSGMNRQSWKFTIVNQQDKIQKLEKAIAKNLNRGDS